MSLEVSGWNEMAITYACEKVCLRRLKNDHAPQHMQEVQEIGRVLGEPSLRLDLFERRRRSPVADHRFGAIEAAIAEPLPQYILARDFVVPHPERDILDEAPADMKAPCGGVVGHGLGQGLR